MLTAELRARLESALDGYRIDRQVAEGGMAIVFLAEDLKHHRQVALKVMKPELGASEGRERFAREIGIAARLSHPHILPVYDSGEADGIHYIVMPFVEDESLRDRLAREGALPPGDAVRITSEIADALGYAHDRGLVHRDIKPANILLQSGHASVTDFGIARIIEDDESTRFTRTGTTLGTFAYMSPEQAAVEAGARALVAVDEVAEGAGAGAVLVVVLAGDEVLVEAGARVVVVGDEVAVVGVEPEGSPNLTRALEEGRPVVIDPITTRVQGLCPLSTGALNLTLAARYVECMVTLSDDEIAAYWRTGEPLGKAGGYAVQGIGAIFIEQLHGSYSGVMGLPVFETAQLLQEFGIRLPGNQNDN